MKYEVVISDTDILIHLGKSGLLQLLDKLFDKIVIPEYVFYNELKEKAEDIYFEIEAKVGSRYYIGPDKKEPNTKKLIDIKYKYHKQFIGKGEAYCLAYSEALEIPLVISDNKNEFRFMEDVAVVLTFHDLLTLGVLKGKWPMEEAERYYEAINQCFSEPSGKSFQSHHTERLERFKNREWLDVLGIDLER